MLLFPIEPMNYPNYSTMLIIITLIKYQLKKMKSVHIPRNLRGFTKDDLAIGDRFTIDNNEIEIVAVYDNEFKAVELSNLDKVLDYDADFIYHNISKGNFHSYQKLECYSENAEEYINTSYVTPAGDIRWIIHIIDDIAYVASPAHNIITGKISRLKDIINKKTITLTKLPNKNGKEIRTVADVNTRKRRGVAIISSSTRQIAGGSRPAGNATTAYHKQKRVEGAKISGNIIIT